MSSQSFHLAKPSLAFAKIVATPTELAWSQVYNAGNIFACLSLSTDEPEEGEPPSLQAIGREVVNILEAEFFGLEEKNITTIQQAITTSLEKVPEEVKVNLCLAFFKDSILYLFIYGAGKVVMKRGGNIGILLEHKDGAHHKIHTASGYVHNEDIIVLQTKEFAQAVTDETLASSLDLALPSDIVEALSPQIHQKENGGPAAIVIAYHGVSQAPILGPEPVKSHHEPQNEPPQALQHQTQAEPEDEREEPVKQTYEQDDYEEDEQLEKPRRKLPSFSLPSFRLPNLPFLKLPRRKLLFIGVFIILVILLLGGILMHKNQQQSAQTTKQFDDVYNPAQQKYDEGKELKSLNQDLSQKDFQSSSQIIKDNLNKFPAGSAERKKLTDLLALDQAELGGTSGSTQPANLDKSKLSLAVLNGSGVAGAAKGTSASLSGKGYTVSTTGNADNFDFTGITIVVKKDKQAYLEQLKKDVAADNSSAKITTKVDDSISTDAEVIVGR